MFGHGFDPKKLKTSLMLCSTRVKQLQKKGENLALRERKDIAELLQRRKIELAKVRTEQIIRDDYLVEAYEILELFCSTLHSRIGLISSKRDTPVDKGIEMHVSSIIWVTQHLYDRIPELRDISLQLEKRYGKDFLEACMEERNEAISAKLMQKLRVEAPPPALVDAYLKAIATKYTVMEYLDHLEGQKPPQPQGKAPQEFAFSPTAEPVSDPAFLPAVPAMLPVPLAPPQQNFPCEYPAPAAPFPGPPSYPHSAQSGGLPPGFPIVGREGDLAPYAANLPSPPVAASSMSAAMKLPAAPAEDLPGLPGPGADGGYFPPEAGSLDSMPEAGADPAPSDTSSNIDFDDLTARFQRLKDQGHDDEK